MYRTGRDDVVRGRTRHQSPTGSRPSACWPSRALAARAADTQVALLRAGQDGMKQGSSR